MSRDRGVRRKTLAIVLVVMGTGAVVLRFVPGQARSLVSIFTNGNTCGGVLNAVVPARYVTPSQLAASNAMVRRVVDGLAVTTADGRQLDWATLSGGAPVVVTFVKQGCPCSLEFEPYFHGVFEAYRDTARFIAIIDDDTSVARRYSEQNSVPYPVIADPERTLIRRFGARNGGYAALLDPEGMIVGYWPGFSASAMSELGHRLSVLANVAERPVATAGLPKNLTRGCPFDVGDVVTTN
jgi:peroxiredoxin